MFRTAEENIKSNMQNIYLHRSVMIGCWLFQSGCYLIVPMYTKLKRNEHSTTDNIIDNITERSHVIVQVYLHWFKGTPVTVALHIFLKQGTLSVKENWP